MSKKSIAEIKEILSQKPLNAAFVAELKNDTRKGVQQLLLGLEKRQEKERMMIEKFKEMSQFENALYHKGCTHIAGIDEAGRGPLAGPVTAAAVILPKNFMLPGLNDSKQLSEKQRDAFAEIIKEEAIAYHIAIIQNEEIDRINIFEATKKAMTEAILSLDPQPDHCLIDAVRLQNLPCPSDSMEKGDAKSISIAAASVLAKTTRDAIMKELHTKYPEYGFLSNMGYGTKVHLDSLNEYGPTPYHRQSFAPVSQAVQSSKQKG